MNKDYRGVIIYHDGRQEIVAIPNVIHENGNLYIPESIHIDGITFILDRGQKVEDYFVYNQVPKVPYRMDLH